MEVLLLSHCAFITPMAPVAGVARAALVMQHGRYRRAFGCDAPCDASRIEQLLNDRTSLRKARDFGAADAILADLVSLNVIIDDDQRSWCLRSWQRPSGNRREQAARHRQESDDKRVQKRAKPRAPRVDTSAPYSRSAACTATISPDQLADIAASMGTRLEAKQQKRYSDADAILADLSKLRVCVSDERREWRADGGTFAAEYMREDGDDASIDASVVDEVIGLLQTRALAKAARDYSTADTLLERLLCLGVIVDDRRRAWRFACAPNTPADGRSDPGHDYVRLRQSDERDAATGKAHLALDPRLSGEIDELLRRRLAAKLKYCYDEADALQSALGVLGVEIEERQRTWDVAFAYVESSWRVRE